MTLKLWKNKKDDWTAYITKGKVRRAYLCHMTLEEIFEYIEEWAQR